MQENKQSQLDILWPKDKISDIRQITRNQLIGRIEKNQETVQTHKIYRGQDMSRTIPISMNNKRDTEVDSTSFILIKL